MFCSPKECCACCIYEFSCVVECIRISGNMNVQCTCALSLSLSVCGCRVKKPAGAVSIFGGVDLLGGTAKSTEEGGGAKVAPPTRKPRGGSGLFGEMEEGEDDIFAFSGKKRYALLKSSFKMQLYIGSTW